MAVSFAGQQATDPAAARGDAAVSELSEFDEGGRRGRARR
jgi:hypothetical protein